MADPLGWVAGALEALEDVGLRRAARHREEPWRHRGLVDLSSNDYLGLARHPRLIAATADGARWGAGAGASRLVVGGSRVHVELEQAIAAWKGTEDAVTFSSGYLANTGTIPALVGPGDVVYSDALNHASIIDGCRLSGASVEVYRHGDVADLAHRMAARAGARRALIVTDGVFSMDGDAADLPAICDLADHHGAMVMVDDAHGGGVLGPDGRGTAAAQGVAHRIDVHLGTLSKAVGAAGGFVAGRGDLVELLRNRARGYVFDTAPPPAVAAAALEGVQIARTDADRRARALANAVRLAEGLGVPAPAACILPLVLGDAGRAMAMSAALAEAGFLVVAIRPPSVPPGTARLRFTVDALLEAATIDGAVAAVRRLVDAHPEDGR